MKYRNAWSWLGLNLGRRAGTVGLVGLILTIALGFGITTLKFRTSNASYLNGNDLAQIENHQYEKLFGGDLIITMFTMKKGTTVNDLFTPRNIFTFLNMQAKLKKDPSVFTVITPLDSLVLTNRILGEPPGSVDPTRTFGSQLMASAATRDPSPKSQTLRDNFIAASLGQLVQVPPAQRSITNPAWVNVLLHNPNGTMRSASSSLFPNNGHAAMAIFLRGHQTIAQESAAAATVEHIVYGTHFDNATTLVTGVPQLLRTINNYLTSGFITLGATAAIVMALILVLLFTVRWRLLPFAIVSVGLVWAFGLTGYFHIPLTLGSIASLPVLLGVGMDYAIQMHSRVEEEVVLARAKHPIQVTARNLGPALLVVTFDAVFAFLALTFAKVPMIRQFGWLLVIGIIAVCVFSIFGSLSFLGIREYKSPTTGKDFSKGVLSRLTVWLGSLPVKTALPFVLASSVILVAGVAVEGHLKMQTDPIQWIDPSAPAVHQVHQVRRGVGTDNYFQVMVRTTHPFSNETAAYVTNLSTNLFDKFPSELYSGTGIVNIAYQVPAPPHTSVVPPTGAQVEALYKLAPPDIQNTLVADNGHALGILFEAKTYTLGQLAPVVRYIRDLHPPAGITVAPGGIAVVGVGLIDNLSASRSLLTYLSIIFVGVFLAVRLRSVIRSLLSLVPVIIAVGSVALFAWALQLQLSPMTAVSGPLVVAVCTEFTSLMLLRFVEERGRGLDPEAAVATTAARTGRAFMVSGLTAVAGIGVIASSPWPLLRGFGTIVGLNVAIALVSALVILPPILVWAEGNGKNLVSRGLTRYIEEEARTVEGNSSADTPPGPGAFHPAPIPDNGADHETPVPVSRILDNGA